MIANAAKAYLKSTEKRCENCNEPSESFAGYEAKLVRFNHLDRTDGALRVCDRCATCYEKRKRAADFIRASTAPKKLIWHRKIVNVWTSPSRHTKGQTIPGFYPDQQPSR
jgi:hypothetical protein